MSLLVLEIRRRRTALMALLWFSLLVSGPLSVLSLQEELIPVAVVSALVGIGCAWLLFRLRRGGAVTRLALLCLTMLSTVIALALTYPAGIITIYAWPPAVPVACYLLLERRLAFPMTLVLLFELGAAYLYAAHANPELMSPLAIAGVLGPTLGLFVVCDFCSSRQARTESTLWERAMRDPLTGLGNRAQLAQVFEQERQLAESGQRPLSVLLIDLDHFKQVNDRYGHDVGDAVLVFVATLLKRRLRDSDCVVRLGGEEFAVLLPGTHKAGAAKVAEELRTALAESRFRYRGVDIRLTLSAGVVEFGRDGTSWRELYRVADVRLYASKKHGRNRVLSALPEPALAPA